MGWDGGNIQDKGQFSEKPSQEKKCWKDSVPVLCLGFIICIWLTTVGNRLYCRSEKVFHFIQQSLFMFLFKIWRFLTKNKVYLDFLYKSDLGPNLSFLKKIEFCWIVNDTSFFFL